jgi:hypothetical protein
LAYREFADETGVVWRVWDTHPLAASTLRSVLPTYAAGWLTFESNAARKRLAPIPPEWESASDELLIHWCARASDVYVAQRTAPGIKESPTRSPSSTR